MITAQLTDPHICRPGVELMAGLNTAPRLEQTVRFVRELDPDLIVMTGDLVNEGSVEEYLHLRSIIEPLLSTGRVRLLPGNHDALAPMREVFPEVPGLDGPYARFVEDGPLRSVGIDSHRAKRPDGELAAEQLEWLDQTLAADPSTPTVVYVHHPPFASGIGFMDAMAMTPSSSEALGTVIAKHAQVACVATGHLHRPTFRSWSGTMVMTAPGIAYGMDFSGRSGRPAGWRDEPPGIAMHLTVNNEHVVHLLPANDVPFFSFGWK